MNFSTDTLIEFPAVPSQRTWRARIRSMWHTIVDIFTGGMALA